MSKKYCIKILFLFIAEFWGAPLNVTPGVREPGGPSHHSSKNVPTQQLCYGKEREGAAPTVGRAGQGGPRRPHTQDGGGRGAVAPWQDLAARQEQENRNSLPLGDSWEAGPSATWEEISSCSLGIFTGKVGLGDTGMVADG